MLHIGLQNAAYWAAICRVLQNNTFASCKHIIIYRQTSAAEQVNDNRRPTKRKHHNPQ